MFFVYKGRIFEFRVTVYSYTHLPPYRLIYGIKLAATFFEKKEDDEKLILQRRNAAANFIGLCMH